ncbi:MAG: 5-formyltetrahydrofolate cyclo-ligase [Actinomycetota bacterium]
MVDEPWVSNRSSGVDDAKHRWRHRIRSAVDRSPVDSELVIGGLRRHLAARRGDGWVVTYAALGHEVDLTPLTDDANLGPFALTRTPDEGFDLTVHPAGSAVERHRFGFDQPTADSPVVPDADITVVLVPALAFDRFGARLGHGAGYYDRFLGRLGPVERIGIAAGPVVAELPVDVHDVAMTHLAGPFGVVDVPFGLDDGAGS